jgi:hypothetical protein
MMVLKGKVALLHHRIPPFLPPLPLSVTFERNLCCFRDLFGFSSAACSPRLQAAVPILTQVAAVR